MYHHDPYDPRTNSLARVLILSVLSGVIVAAIMLPCGGLLVWLTGP